MRAQVEVEAFGTDDARIHGGAGRDVLGLAHRVANVLAEETRVMALLDDDVGDGRTVVARQHQTRGSNTLHLLAKHLQHHHVCMAK